MIWVLFCCALGGLLAAFFTRLFKRVPRSEVPQDTRRFYVRLDEVLRERHAGIEVVGLTRQGFGAVLRVDRQEVAVPLGEAFLRERAFPAGFDDIVDRLVTEIRQHLTAIGDLPFDEAVQRVLPQIRSEEWLRTQSPAFGPGRIPTTPIFDDLVTCYVLDEPGSMVFVTEGHLDAWGRRVEEIDNIAMANLRRLAAEDGGLPVPAADDKEPRVLHTGDGYDAARLLLALDDVDAAPGFVLAVPDRDTLVVGAPNADLSRLMGDVGAEYRCSDHPISPRVYKVSEGRLELASRER
jgi:uncharacterized protein YtpQ (UPF0354 family)